MLHRVLFIGSKESGLNVLKTIHKVSPDTLVGCVTVDDSDDSRSKLEEFRKFTKNNSIDLKILSGKCDLTESVKKYKPELCIVMGWYYIIAEELLTQVIGGFVGIHNSLLPAHRGFAPVVWSMIAGDKQTGFSVFSFDGGMDTGDIWYQGIVDIKEDDHIGDVLKKIDDQIELFFETRYIEILEGKMRPVKQKTTGITYGARRTPEDGLIDWNSSADEIYDFIRAQSKPYPGAYSKYKSKKITIWNARVFPHKIQGMPGQIGLIDRDRNSLVVVCGHNTGLVLDYIEIDGTEIGVTNVIKSLNYKMGM